MKVGVGGVGEVMVGKWRQLYLNDNKKEIHTKMFKKKRKNVFG